MFVIVGGVTRTIPLTGVTLPFVSYGGSSIMANFVLLALLLLVSDKAQARPAVNAPIRRLYMLFLVLFGVLVYFTSKDAVFDAKALRDNPLNRRALLEEQRIHRGTIRAADGTIVARSRSGSAGGVYSRRYPTDGLFAHAIGYSYTTLGRAGLELYRNDELTGKNNELTSILDQLRGKRQVGDNIRTTLDPAAQKVAYDQLAGRHGAVVALDPRNGDLKVMASVPTYDPNLLRSPKTYSRLANDNANKPLVNRATQFGYAPGSTFKVVTATAAIDSGQFTPTSTVDGKNGVKISGVPLQNDFNQSFGPITLAAALEQSVNTVYAQVGEKLGKRTMREYMKRFGFNRKPQLDYPADQMSASGEYHNGHLLSPTVAASSTSGAWRSARTSSRSCRCRWRRSPRRSPTAASS